VGHVYLRTNNSEELASAGIWHLEDEDRFAAFREASERCRFAPERDCPAVFWLPVNPSGSSI
jgi:hypothetical protein